MANSSLDATISEHELRQLTGKSHATLWRWKNAEIIPPSHKCGPNSKFWFASDIRKWQLMLKVRTWISNYRDRVPAAVLTWIEDRRYRPELPKDVLIWLEARKAELPKEFLELLEGS